MYYPSSVRVNFVYSQGSSARSSALVPRDVVAEGRTAVINWLLKNEVSWGEPTDLREPMKSISAHSIEVVEEHVDCIGAVRMHRSGFKESMDTLREIHNAQELCAYLRSHVGDVEGLSAKLFDADPDVRPNLSFGKPVWSTTYAILRGSEVVAYTSFDPCTMCGLSEAKES